MLVLALLLGCKEYCLCAGPFPAVTVNDDGSFDAGGLTNARFAVGEGEGAVEMRFGSFRFDDDDATLATTDAVISGGALTLLDRDGRIVGDVLLSGDDQRLVLEVTPTDPANRIALSAPCDPDDHFLGAGAHAQDVDHVGEKFALWVSEPGIGKTTDEVPPDDWYLRGTKHASSFPAPFLIRPHRSQSILADTYGRVELDLCATDPGRFELVVWDETARFELREGTPLELARAQVARTELAPLPPPWVFAPWNDAVRGPERVREVAAALRAAGAPSSVIWTEDWRGAEQTSVGYHLSGEWFLDEALYPDASGLAAELEAGGFKWFAYFSPFVRSDTVSWDLAEEAGVLIQDADGEPYRFAGVTFTDESMVDLSGEAGREWARAWLDEALDLGFDGWMADYAEWLPPDAVLASGESGWTAHNRWPELWQQVNSEAIDGRDATYFSRSGWLHRGGLAPVIWAGDQRTSFDADDGLPTVVAMGLGLSASGVPIYTHDVAGYQSIGNPPSTKELWFRWASLGAYTPILRTHHGAFDDQNWQLDSDAETLAHWAKVASEHTRLFPYRYGLAAQASADGTPMILPVSFLFPTEDWGRTDAWMLGRMLVAPVIEAGATERHVDLPPGRWFDWHTRQPATSGVVPSAVGEIPVFVPEGTIIPTFATVPQTLIEESDPDLIGLSDADGERVVYVFGTGGSFTEADGTTYSTSGTATVPGEATGTGGDLVVDGLTVHIDGPVRDYRVVVTP